MAVREEVEKSATLAVHPSVDSLFIVRMIANDDASWKKQSMLTQTNLEIAGLSQSLTITRPLDPQSQLARIDIHEHSQAYKSYFHR